MTSKELNKEREYSIFEVGISKKRTDSLKQELKKIEEKFESILPSQKKVFNKVVGDIYNKSEEIEIKIDENSKRR